MVNMDYEKNFRKSKGTKTVKVSKDVYDSLLYIKGSNPKDSIYIEESEEFEEPDDFKQPMTSTVIRLLQEYMTKYDCHIVQEYEDNNGRYYSVKAKNGKKRRVPVFSAEKCIIRVSKDVHKALTDFKIHPEESLNMVIFRLICSYYQNKNIYRIFTQSGCGNCSRLKYIVGRIIENNNKISDDVFVEVVDADTELFKKDIVRHAVYMAPLSILYSANGEEVWSRSGLHSEDEVKAALMMCLPQ